MFLFKYNNQELCYSDFLTGLKNIGANECKTLFIHSDIFFGQINPTIKRQDFINNILQLFDDLNVENIIMPVFSYSFINQKDFNVKESRSLMGTLSENFRKRKGVYRTEDPLCSFAIQGKLSEKFRKYKPENNSLGIGSYFNLLDKEEDVKYLFFGADLAEHFTYVHYIECILNVPYRFNMVFNGNIIDYDGNTYNTDWIINTQCGGVKLYKRNDHYKQYLIENSKLKYNVLGEKEISCISQKDARETIIENIKKNKYYFLERPYTEKDLTHEYVMWQEGKAVTHC